MYDICICGGGNEAHALAVSLSNKGYQVSVLTRSPNRWKSRLSANRSGGNTVLFGNIKATDKPEEVIPTASIILVSVPAYAYEDVLTKISPHISENSILGAIPGTGGFDYFCEKYVPSGITYFSSQRVPYIARIQEYGSSVNITGEVHGGMKYAISDIKESDRVLSTMQKILDIESSSLGGFLCVNLVNSNSLLHTVRLYSLGKHDEVWSKAPLFYGEWDIDSSKLFVECDRELFNLYDAIPDRDFSCMTTVLNHYECRSPEELTEKIKSIKSLSQLKTPSIASENGFSLDFSSRYFTEDFPYGIAMMSVIAERYGVRMNAIDKVASWGMQKIGKDMKYVRELFNFQEEVL